MSLDVATRLVLPPHPGSLRLGRHATLAWLQIAPRRYDNGTVLLLVTEILAHALERAVGPLVLTVGAQGRQLRVEVVDHEPADLVPERRQQLKMTALLADRWGAEIRLLEGSSPARVVWFECRELIGPREDRAGWVTRSG